MARIGAEDLEQLKRETDLVALVQASGVELSGSGDNLRGLCPFHEESEASFSVSPTKQLWNCLGACQEGGDVIKFVMLHKRVNFRHAVELLKHGAATSHGGGTVPVLPCPLDVSADDQTLMNQVVAFYEERLAQGPEAQRYLLSRHQEPGTGAAVPAWLRGSDAGLAAAQQEPQRGSRPPVTPG